jgi:hypothetical protein
VIALLLLAAAAPAPAAPGPVLNCRLVTPSGDPIAFAARLGSPTAVLEPDPRSAWPRGRVIGPGAWSEGKAVEAEYSFAGKPAGVHLKVRGERATLSVGKSLRGAQPRAHGFCLRMSEPSPAPSDAPVLADAGANVPAFDTARWPDDCSLMTRSGRRARIGYRLLDVGARSEFTTAAQGFFAESPTVATRRQGGGRSRFNGPNGLAGDETLILDEKTATGVQLLDFDKVGIAPATVESAAAICGIKRVVRRPNSG